MPCALSVFPKKLLIYFSKLYVFLYENVARIYQSIQNPAIPVGLENDKNDPIQKDEINCFQEWSYPFQKDEINCFQEWSYPKGRDKLFPILYSCSDNLSHYKT